MILTAAASMFIPHPPNFSPLGAIALFGGARFADRRAAFLVPLAAMFLSDLVTGLHLLVPLLYGSYAIAVCLGRLVRKKENAASIVEAALGASIVFFLVTNFGVWAMLDTYQKTGNGLWACYVAGLPYFQNTVLGNLFFSALLFGGFALVERRYPVLRPVSARGVPA
jgi:hypothetical protein